MLKKKYIPKKLTKDVLKIALPILIQQLLISSFGFVNTFLISGIDAHLSLSAVSIALSYEAFVNCIFFAITTSISSFTLEYLGKKEDENVKNSFFLMLFFNMLIAFLQMFLIYCFHSTIIHFFSNQNTNKEIISLANQYIKYVTPLYLAMAINQTFSAMYRNFKKTYIPLIITIISFILNFSLTYYLIYFTKLGINSIVIGTLVANYSSVICFFFLYILKRPKKRLHPFSCLNQQFALPILKKTLPLLINETCIGLSFTFYTKIFLYAANEYPSYVMADKISLIFLNTTYGFANAASVLIGLELGKGDKQKAYQYHQKFRFFSFIYALFLVFLLSLFGPTLLKLYKNPNADAKIFIYYLGIKVFFRCINMLGLATLRVLKSNWTILILDGGMEYVLHILPCFLFILISQRITIISLILLSQVGQIIRYFFIYQITNRQFKELK